VWSLSCCQPVIACIGLSVWYDSMSCRSVLSRKVWSCVWLTVDRHGLQFTWLRSAIALSYFWWRLAIKSLSVLRQNRTLPADKLKKYYHSLVLARYVPNVAKRRIWDQCNIENRPTNGRPLFSITVHGRYGPPIGSWHPGVEWSRDRWRHVTPKNQGRDPIIFDSLYLRNGAR